METIATTVASADPPITSVAETLVAPGGVAAIFLVGIVWLWRYNVGRQKAAEEALAALHREYQSKLDAKDAKIFDLFDAQGKMLDKLGEIAAGAAANRRGGGG